MKKKNYKNRTRNFYFLPSSERFKSTFYTLCCDCFYMVQLYILIKKNKKKEMMIRRFTWTEDKKNNLWKKLIEKEEL